MDTCFFKSSFWLRAPELQLKTFCGCRNQTFIALFFNIEVNFATYRSSRLQMFLKIDVVKNFAIFKAPVLESIFDKVVFLQACNFVKKETPMKVSSCEYCRILRTTFLTEHLQLELNIYIQNSKNTCHKKHLSKFSQNCK